MALHREQSPNRRRSAQLNGLASRSAPKSKLAFVNLYGRLNALVQPPPSEIQNLPQFGFSNQFSIATIAARFTLFPPSNSGGRQQREVPFDMRNNATRTFDVYADCR